MATSSEDSVGGIASAEDRFKNLLTSSGIDVGDNFLKKEVRDAYSSSKLFEWVKAMPKGALLHTHGIATASFARLVDFIVANERVLVWMPGAEDGCVESENVAYAFRYQTTSGDAKDPSLAGIESGWYSAEQIHKLRGKAFWDCIYDALTLTYDEKIASSNKELWIKFNSIWSRLFTIMSTLQFYFFKGGFLWTIFEDCLSNGVTYVEIKEGLFCAKFVDANAGLAEVDNFTALEAFKSTVDAFREAHPTFVGAKIVGLQLKFAEPELVTANVEELGRLKARFPQEIAGFDLAGDENALRPMSDYVQGIRAGLAACEKASGVRVPIMVHAGESNDPWNRQIFDAVEVGAERIGHAYALPRHPELLKTVAEKGIVVECCPLSNQVLGLVGHLANHPGLLMLRNGVSIVICPDDAGIWHAGPDVTYDICAVAVAWGLKLEEIRCLLRNSLSFSTLGTDPAEAERLNAALVQFDKDWTSWLSSFQES